VGLSLLGGLVTCLAYNLKVLGEGPIYWVKTSEERPLLNMKYLKSTWLIRHMNEQVSLPLPPLDPTNSATWLAIAQPLPPQHAIPAEGQPHYDPNMPTNPQLMNYLVEMNTGLEQRYTILEQRYKT
jgi:hypothetical protein